MPHRRRSLVMELELRSIEERAEKQSKSGAFERTEWKLIVAGGREHDRRVFGAILRRITALPVRAG